MKRMIALVILATLVGGVYLAIQVLPWWALLLGAVALVVIGKIVAGRILRALITIPFKAKGAALRGASVQVHKVLPLEAVHESTEGQPRFEIEVTISPATSDGPFQSWEPGDLRLVRPGSKVDPDSETDDESCNIESLEIEQEGVFKADEGMKYGGPQRLKLVVSVVPGVSALKFRYYFEEFGSIQLPKSLAAAA